MLEGRLWTVFGWQVRTPPHPNARSLRNFPCQANGAEMLRLAMCLATERGVRVVAPVHDAILIEAPLRFLDEAVRQTRRAMDEASAAVLDGFVLRTDAKTVRHPDHYRDPRGETFWNVLLRVLEDVKRSSPHSFSPPHPLLSSSSSYYAV